MLDTQRDEKNLIKAIEQIVFRTDIISSEFEPAKRKSKTSAVLGRPETD